MSRASTLALSPTPALRRLRAFEGTPEGLRSPQTQTPMKAQSPKTPMTPMKVQSPKTPMKVQSPKTPMKVQSPKTPKSAKSGSGKKRSDERFVTPMKATRKTVLKDTATPPKRTKTGASKSQKALKKPSGRVMVLKKPGMATPTKVLNKWKKDRFEAVMGKISSDWEDVKGYNKFWKSELENRGWMCSMASKPCDWRKWSKVNHPVGPPGCYTDSDAE
eukprot:s2217_g6.t1